ncbi:Centrosomal protein of 120 kDa [Frankliniella fusca]|uniref:Centrosomal protein of 120 kDa n=1 Tax=Frankliniella fusca TaxID=407009 RepID=A0AAE1I140_9NEOP|nr:Centrosomal protein of 120 kDa [Frankliniella fusca]
MSLQELLGSTVHLRLSIREGHGFGFLKKPIIVVAVTNGIPLETEVVPPSPDPLFHIDLVWETDKKNLRRFRASNTPIKLECFTIGVGNQRECIGSILLNIKSAQVIVGNNQNVNEKWHRLIGVPADAKALQPELLLSLTIQSPNSLSQPLSGRSWDGKGTAETVLSAKKPPTPKFKDAPKNLQPLSTLPSLVPDCKQGYIQLGEENSCIDTFLFHLCAKRLQEIELLHNSRELPIQSDIGKCFQISFTVFGQNVETKCFGDTNIGNECMINEEVVLPIRTSLSILHNYLQENPCATLCLLFNGQEIAASELHIRSLVPTSDVQSFSRDFNGEALLSQKCTLVSSRSGTVPLQDNLQPFIEVTTRLQLVSHLTGFPKAPLTNNSKITPTSNYKNSISTSHISEETPSRSESRHSQDTFIVTKKSGPVWVPVAPGSAQSHPPFTTKISSEDSGSLVRIKIVLNQLELFQPPKSPCVRFLFECPSSSAVTSTEFSIPNGKCSVLVDGISAEVLVRPVDTIQIHVFGVEVESTTSLYIASAKIDITSSSLTQKGETQVSCHLRGPLHEQDVGFVLATISLHGQLMKESGQEATENFVRLGSNFSLSKPLHNLTAHNVEGAFKSTNAPDNAAFPTTINSSESKITDISSEKRIPSSPNLQAGPSLVDHQTVIQAFRVPLENPSAPLDLTAAYRIVEELEDWKEKQQEIFQAGLKEKEKEHIDRITDEWTAQTKAQNILIDNKMAECKALIESLASAKQDLRDRLKTCATREQALTKAKEDLELQYNLKFQEFTLAAKRLDEGFKLKVSLVESKCSKLEERIKELESENESLHQQLKQKVLAQHGDGQMCGMSHNQVSQLLSQVDQLESKLHASLQSKAYFKEQWGRAVREMNQAKLQFAQSSESNKCFEKILGKEEKELHNDQRTLEMLRREIAHLNL